jgi:hypothetical protein
LRSKFIAVAGTSGMPKRFFRMYCMGSLLGDEKQYQAYE